MSGEHVWVVLGNNDTGADSDASVHQRAWRRMIERARAFASVERVLAVVLEQDQPWWAAPLQPLPHDNLVVQPFDRGTATGLLVCLLRILHRDPQARVVFITADVADALDLGAASTLLGRFMERQPKLLRSVVAELEGAHMFDSDVLDRIYPFLPETDLMRDVFAPAERREQPLVA